MHELKIYKSALNIHGMTHHVKSDISHYTGGVYTINDDGWVYVQEHHLYAMMMLYRCSKRYSRLYIQNVVKVHGYNTVDHKDKIVFLSDKNIDITMQNRMYYNSRGLLISRTQNSLESGKYMYEVLPLMPIFKKTKQEP